MHDAHRPHAALDFRAEDGYSGTNPNGDSQRVPRSPAPRAERPEKLHEEAAQETPQPGRPSRFLIAAEVAKLLRESERTVRRWADAGILPAVRVGRRWLFEEKEIERVISEGRSPWKSC